MAKGTHSRRSSKPVAGLTKNKQGLWIVQIDYPDGRKVIASPGEGARVHYDRPQNVPNYLKHDIVPKLVQEARLRNLQGV